MLGKLELAALTQRAHKVVAMLEDSNESVRHAALHTIDRFEPKVLAQHVDAVVAQLEVTNREVRGTALKMLRKLAPAALAPHANAVLATLGDTAVVTTLPNTSVNDFYVRTANTVRAFAMRTLRYLPKFVTHNVDFEAANLRSRLLGRLSWYKCRLRLRVRSHALYWYALPYRPSGPGHARDVEAWDRMNKRSRRM